MRHLRLETGYVLLSLKEADSYGEVALADAGGIVSWTRRWL